MSDPAKEKILLSAIEWVIRDASFKAPEEIGPVCERWLDHLTAALNRYLEINDSR
jgi:hypothetical protein